MPQGTGGAAGRACTLAHATGHGWSSRASMHARSPLLAASLIVVRSEGGVGVGEGGE